ncbi:MAG: DNA topoisomerase IV subunit A [Lentisphaerae bacterium]|nr:DNA topoisomerase IV subunit A [Lentisphaerota bacterium]
MSDEKNLPVPPEENLENPAVENNSAASEENDTEDAVSVVRKRGGNEYFRQMMDRNFLDYASYVIGSRAIPDVDDGLKPVQRRILWTLYQNYDNGRPTKTANIVGNTMHYHPHGDASIGDAIVVLANKGGCIERMEKDSDGVEKLRHVNIPYFIHKEGNFGNILTGSPAAATRYTECALSKLAYETMFNNDITNFIPNYDGRKKEPTQLPAKVPSLLMLGSDGIAVGMSTLVLPHNFNELIDAEIAHLRGEEFELYPDFQQGGVMDVREYLDGNGKITLRARIDIEGRELVIREIPATTNTGSLIASIERAAEKNKIRIASINDFTTDQVEIRITPTRGYEPEKTRQGLFMYTDCSVSISPKMTVICDRRPVQMSVSEVLKRNVGKLLDYLRREFEIEQARLLENKHAKTLAQLFFENRIYKRIEECRSQEEEYKEVMDGLAPFRDQLLRDVTNEDIDKLLALPVRRIARFDIEKNQQEIRAIEERLKEIRHHLKHLVEYTIGYLEDIKERYGKNFPRRTEIENIDKIDRTRAALNNIKVFWDRKNGHAGTTIKSEDVIMCNEFDKILCVERSGVYVIYDIPDKMHVGKLYDFRKYDAKQEFGIIYSEKKTGKFYGKRSTIDKFIKEKKYTLCPEGCRLELFTPRPDAIYELEIEAKRGGNKHEEINLMTLPVRSPKARGFLIGANIIKITHQRYLEEAELTEFMAAAAEAAEDNAQLSENTAVPEAAAAVAGSENAEQLENSSAQNEAIESQKDAAEVKETSEKTDSVADISEAKAIEDSDSTIAANVESVADENSNGAPDVEEIADEKAESAPVVVESTAAVEVEAEAEAELGPDAAATPAEEPETAADEPVLECESTDDVLILDGSADKGYKKVRRPAIRPIKNDSVVPDKPDDDLGIVQPELGF